MVIAICFSLESLALPTPFSAEELYEQSDVIANVKVLGVINIGEQQNATRYQAWLKIIKPIKGQIKNNETIIVNWSILHKKLIGGWEVSYYPGEILKTHLIWDRQEKTYRTLSWDSVRVLKKVSPPNTVLPREIGNVSLALDYYANPNVIHYDKVPTK